MPQAEDGEQATGRSPWPALMVVLSGSFMAILDTFIVLVAAPAIQAGLHASSAQIQLILVGYQVTYAVALITGARLGDHYGRKRLFSSCDLGLSAVHPGDELQGLAASLLGLGTRTVIASLGPVDDRTTLALTADLYRRLRAGAPPAAALAAAQAATLPEHAVSAANFVCMGAG